jgi:glycosyltransferase involved in cell wall biosynthesis
VWVLNLALISLMLAWRTAARRIASPTDLKHHESTAGASRRVLVFSPLMAGHREVYMSVLTDIALEAGWEGERLPCAHLERYRQDPRVSFVDVAEEPRGGLDMSLERLTRLVSSSDCQVTVLAHADNHLRLLSSQLSRTACRLPGRRVGIFISSTNFVHGAGRNRSPREWARHYKHYARTWRDQPALFHRLLLPRFDLLDSALCLDEGFVQGRGTPYAWLPDIGSTLGADEREPSKESVTWRRRLEPFLADNSGRAFFVYYGTAQARRGYDALLRLAVEENGCLVHVGRRADQDRYAFDVVGLRRELARRSALFETGEYLKEFDTAAAFLECAHHVVLPYRWHYGSSGVMLQSLRAGRPVLVPNIGLMAQRVVRYRLGHVYKHGDWADLCRQHSALSRRDPDEFRGSIQRFLKYFSEPQIRSAVRLGLGLPSHGATPPSV